MQQTITIYTNKK